MRTQAQVVAALLGYASTKMQGNFEKMELIAEGILHGAISAEFTGIDACITDAQEIVIDSEAAVKDFETKDPVKILEGLKEVAKVIMDVKNAVSDCKSIKGDMTKMEKFAESLSSPESFAYHVGKDLVVNGRSIYTELDNAIGDYEKADWEGFGYNAGQAAAKAIIGQEKLTSAAGKRFAQVLQGAVKAFGLSINFEELLACIGDEDKAALALDQAIGQFEAAVHDKNSQEAIAGVILTVAGLMQAKKGLAECEAAAQSSWDFKGFTRSEELMSHPTKYFNIIGKDVLIHGKSIYKDIGSAVNAWESNNFEQFGENVGDILHLASEEKVTQNLEWMQERREPIQKVDRKDVTSFLQGFLEATNVGKFNFTALLECIFEVDQDAQILDAVVHTTEDAIKNHDVQEGFGAMIGAVAFVQAVKRTLPVCKQVDQKSMDWTVFNQIVDTIENPAKQIQFVENNITLNGKDITSDMMKTVFSFMRGDYQGFGQGLGATLKDTCAPEEQLFIY